MMTSKLGLACMTIAVVLLTCSFSSGPAYAEEKASFKNYAAIKTGIYNPTGDLDNFDNGLNVEGLFGRYFTDNFALEGGLGIFGTKATFSGTNAVLGTFTEEDKIAAIPVTLTAKGILPLDRLELFAGAGLGVYFAAIDATLSTSALGNFTVDDGDMVLGVHFTGGGSYNITDRFYFGIDGKYISTDDASFQGVALGTTYTIKTDLTGWMVNGFFGYRF